MTRSSPGGLTLWNQTEPPLKQVENSEYVSHLLLNGVQKVVSSNLTAPTILLRGFGVVLNLPNTFPSDKNPLAIVSFTGLASRD